MDTLESKWNNIVCYAPIRLLRLQFERIENIIVKELKQAEDELNDELRLLEKQRDTTDILRRHNEHFQLNNFQPTMDTHIRNLHSFANDIRIKDTNTSHDNDQVDQRTIKLNDYWIRMQAKIDNVKRKLQTVPKKWQEFEEKYVLEIPINKITLYLDFILLKHG
jgi:nesprin-1